MYSLNGAKRRLTFVIWVVLLVASVNTSAEPVGSSLTDCGPPDTVKP